MRTRPVVANTPCAKCPFRKDVPIYLRRARRVEIATSLLEGAEFPCHATVDYSEDEEGDEELSTANSSMCAGSVKAMLQDGTPNQMLRVAQSLGMVDLDRAEARGAEVWGLIEWQALAEGATADNPEQDEEEIETCNTVNANCLAPAGYAIGGGVALGTEAADLICPDCGEAVCSNCADAEGRCGGCSENQWEDES